jgi:transposase-like protein
MTIAEREQQILRVKEQSFQPELEEALEQKLREGVLEVVKMTLEAALVEEVKVSLTEMNDQKPRRSGFFQRTLDTQYGHIPDLKVPKLRHSNEQRQWKILERYQRCLGHLFNWICCLYVMGLSLRDLQEALYPILGHVLSHNAVNHITLKIQQQVDIKRLAPLPMTPQIILVDGVWVDILYPTQATKIDRAGHERQCRQAEERVILAAMAVWADGSYSILHYQIANSETEQAWSDFFDNLIAKGLDVNTVELVVSDGTTGLPAVIEKKLPHAQQQRCITHKVRGITRYLTYKELSNTNEHGQTVDLSVAKAARRDQIESDAYDIFDAPNHEEASVLLAEFQQKWNLIEPDAVRNFTRDINLCFTFYQFDSSLHTHIRTTNHLERLFREFRTKTDEIGTFPHENSCLTLFFLVMQRDHAKHNRLPVAKTS